MEKKVYMCPQIEVEKINLTRCLLEGSPVDPPVPPHPAPERRTEVF